MSEFDAQNGAYLDKLISEGTIVKQFLLPVLQVMKGYAEEAINDLIGSDALSNNVYISYNAFRKKANAWSKITVQAF